MAQEPPVYELPDEYEKQCMRKIFVGFQEGDTALFRLKASLQLMKVKRSESDSDCPEVLPDFFHYMTPKASYLMELLLELEQKLSPIETLAAWDKREAMKEFNKLRPPSKSFTAEISRHTQQKDLKKDPDAKKRYKGGDDDDEGTKDNNSHKDGPTLSPDPTPVSASTTHGYPHYPPGLGNEAFT